MNPCDEPEMSNAAWRAFLAAHPHWHAPPQAPCAGPAVHKWLRRAAVALGAAGLGTGAALGAAVLGANVGAAPLGGVQAPIAPFGAGNGISAPAPQIYQVVGGTPAAPVDVPEPSSLLLLGSALVLLGLVLLVRRACRS